MPRNLILTRPQVHNSLYAGSRVLNLASVPETPGTANVVITRDMVGSVIPGKKGRKGHATLSVT